MNVRLLQLVRISAPIAAALLVTANHGQAAGVTSFDVPSGGAVYEQVTLGKTEMKDLKGQTMYSYPLALKRTGGALPKIKVKVALPKGQGSSSKGKDAKVRRSAHRQHSSWGVSPYPGSVNFRKLRDRFIGHSSCSKEGLGLPVFSRVGGCRACQEAQP